MTGVWHRTRDLVGLPGMPGERAIQLHGTARGWTCREAPHGRRTVLEWLEESLPEETQAALREARGADAVEIALPCALGGRVAAMDARVEIVAAFDRWRPQGAALVPALKEWCGMYRADGAGVSAETRAAVPSVAWNTLQRWRNARRNGVEALMHGKGGRISGVEADADLHTFIASMLYKNPNHLTAKNILRAVEARFPDRSVPSISTVRRFARRWRDEHAFELSAVADPDGHRSRTMPAFGSESEAIEALNACWELDSTRIDVMCADGRRHALVAAIDVWSRRMKMLVTRQSRAAAITALIRRCLLDWGVPERIRTDEGADYTSRHLRRVLRDLAVSHEILPPYSPDKKPFIERGIGTISHDLFTQLAGFTGHNVAQAQKLRERKSFAARRGEDKTLTFRCGLTPEELQGRIDAWCETLYGREPHSGLEGLSPFEKAASWSGPRRTVAERGLDVLLAEPAGDGRRKVGKSGISVDGSIYIAAELGRHMGRWVHVRQDPADYGRIYVFTEPDEDGRSQFLCIAEDPLRVGIDRQAVAAEARRLWRAESKAARKEARELEREHRPADVIDEVLDRASEDSSAVIAFPAPADEHSTDAMEAAAEAAEAAARAAAEADPDRARAVGGREKVLAAMKAIHREDAS